MTLENKIIKEKLTDKNEKKVCIWKNIAIIYTTKPIENAPSMAESYEKCNKCDGYNTNNECKTYL